MKFAAIITYTTGESTGATVQANDRSGAWQKLLEAFDGGASIRQVTLAQVLTKERIIK